MTDDKQLELFQALGRLEEGMKHMQEIVPLVVKHEQVYKAGKWLVLPGLAALHISFKHLLSKL